MTTIRQLIQTGPAKANELFAKLGDTSDTAVKTRERLFAELKEELELLARLEEEHIFPVLRKNKNAKGLVPDALNDNKLTRKLLVQLEGMPKDSEEFADGLTELRRTFQQHVRDDCRSPHDFIAMQSELARDAMQQVVETSRRIGQVSKRVADEAAGVIQARANAKPERARQVA